ncbi:MAG: type I-E CRISPR-associated protein Cas7/Cse4/CasC [Acidobacteriota bacterium]|nr:type I-E CRISPR-associated protein Cas7/Cse4/CasC [Acidobacteriota bacterium]
MNLELHILQNFAPSNLNRSDTGSPKDCTFGGYRRARISSQSFKRAMRDHFKKNFPNQNNLAERSTRLLEAISQHLVDAGKDEAEAKRIVAVALSSLKLIIDEGRTQYLIFMGRDEIKAIADVCLENYDELLEISPEEKAEDGEELSAKDLKKATSKVPKEITKALDNVLDGGKASDLALFGRMLADLPDKNRDAASQVAHAISTHKVGVEFDFYTAVDDLKPDDTSGADMLGVIEFNSACFYRYANIDVDKLRENLQGDEELTEATVDAFLKAAVEAIPTGKQNSFATHERPAFVLAVVRDGSLCSLANAFAEPAKESRDKGLIENSVEKFVGYWNKINDVYGDNSKAKNLVNLSDADLGSLNESDAKSFDNLIQNTKNAIFKNGEE